MAKINAIIQCHWQSVVRVKHFLKRFDTKGIRCSFVTESRIWLIRWIYGLFVNEGTSDDFAAIWDSWKVLKMKKKNKRINIGSHKKEVAMVCNVSDPVKQSYDNDKRMKKEYWMINTI